MDRRHECSGRYPFTEGTQGCRDKLIKARLKRSWSQSEVAKLIGCSQEQYSRIEGNSRDGKRYWPAISDIFEIPPEEFEEFMEPCKTEPEWR